MSANPVGLEGAARGARVAYLVKRYPRYSETFIVNEILAHEAAGFDVSIHALKPSNDTHFQDAISRVRAPVQVIDAKGLKPSRLWAALADLEKGGTLRPEVLAMTVREDVALAYQAMRLASSFRERGIEHVHAHFGTSPATVARLAAALAGISYSFTAHAKDLYHDDFDLEGFRARHAPAATIVTISEFNRHFLVDECGFAPEQVVVVRNGLDLRRFTPSRTQTPRTAPRVTAVGRLIEKKGFDVLVEACRRLRDRGLDFRCQIVGAGPLEAALRERIRASDLGDRVHLTGPLPQEQTLATLRASSVFAAPCVVAGDGDRDGVPTTILEAMALGVPCISTDVTGIPEVVQHERTGLAVAQHDPDALADGLERLLGNPGLGSSLARNARELIEKDYDARANTAALRGVFEDAIQANGSRERTCGGPPSSGGGST